MSVREIKKKLKKEISRIFQIMSELKNLKSGGIIFFFVFMFFYFFFYFSNVGFYYSRNLF